MTMVGLLFKLTTETHNMDPLIKLNLYSRCGDCDSVTIIDVVVKGKKGRDSTVSKPMPLFVLVRIQSVCLMPTFQIVLSL